MKIPKLNWPIWVGLLLSLVALFSYPFVFVRWPITRDFPWANLLLFVIAVVFVFVGLRRAFAPQQPHPMRSRIGGSLLATISVLVLGLFIFTFFVASKWLPASRGAPQIGQKAPDFILADTNGRPVSLSELLSAPISGKAAPSNPRGVLMIFYRGYW